MGDEEVRAEDGHREPHILLQGGEPRFSATVGCNQMIGGYALSGAALRFEAGASTMMACPPPLDELEFRLRDVLAATAGWTIHGQFLEFTDAAGKPLALFQSVYLR
jgi:heat shock protein HslJ